MSSFIIDRKEYIKAAGLMCGFEEAKRHSHKWFIDNVRQEFEHAYALNVISVNEQYGDNEVPDENRYDDVFEAYRKMGTLIGNDGYASDNGIIYEKVQDVIDKATFRLQIFSFFNSVLYQIENDAAYRTVAALFYTCLDKLYESDLRGVDSWHSEVKLAA